MLLPDRLTDLVRLGEHLSGPDDYLDAVIKRTAYHNPWFTEENQRESITAIAKQFLDPQRLRDWLADYRLTEPAQPQRVGLVLAGNIPLVGFHDVLSVFVTGHRAVIKLSDKDPYLLPYLVKLLARFDERAADYFTFVEKLRDYDAVIATGSNNSARYFEAYFKDHPHIIRRNRNGVAVLTGEESAEELHELGRDVFRYFGLGCRSIAKLFVPVGYDFDPLLTALHEFRQIQRHSKYKNNFDYNYALFLLNKVHYHANGSILITENESFQSHIAGLYYSTYSDLGELETTLRERADEIQLISARPGLLSLPTQPFGQAQEPALDDYADGVDTIAFLQRLRGEPVG
jgi:hypothetical protein